MRNADAKRSRPRGIIDAPHQGLVRSLVVSLVAPAGWEPVALCVLTGSVVACEVEVASFAREAPVRRNAIVLAANQRVALRVVTRGIVTRRVERPRGARNTCVVRDALVRCARVCRVCRRFLKLNRVTPCILP